MLDSDERPDNATKRVQVVRCINGRTRHTGKWGWLLEGDRVSVDNGQFMVRLDHGVFCVATVVR